MTKTLTNNTKLTRSDKAHQKFMDKLVAVKDGAEKGMDSIGRIHEQTVKASNEYAKIVSESQKFERMELYEIIKTSNDAEKINRAYKRLEELDCIKEKIIEKHNEFLCSERENSNKNITGIFFCILVAGGYISSNKQLRQIAKNTLVKINKNFLFKK